MDSYGPEGGYSKNADMRERYHCWAAAQYREKVCLSRATLGAPTASEEHLPGLGTIADLIACSRLHGPTYPLDPFLPSGRLQRPLPPRIRLCHAQIPLDRRRIHSEPIIQLVLPLQHPRGRLKRQRRWRRWERGILLPPRRVQRVPARPSPSVPRRKIRWVWLDTRTGIRLWRRRRQRSSELRYELASHAHV